MITVIFSYLPASDQAPYALPKPMITAKTPCAITLIVALHSPATTCNGQSKQRVKLASTELRRHIGAASIMPGDQSR